MEQPLSDSYPVIDSRTEAWQTAHWRVKLPCRCNIVTSAHMSLTKASHMDTFKEVRSAVLPEGGELEIIYKEY